MTGSRIENQRHFHILLIAASCALSALAILRDPVINDDGVFYLMLAREIADHGLSSAFALFDRPLYPLLIAGLHGVSGLPLLASAHLLNTALLALLVLSFTRFAATLCGDARLAPWAALLILLFPQLNEYRSFVLRDFGFWALLFTSLLPLLRYQQTRRWQDGLLWAATGIAAAAFRPEALAFMAVLPLGCLRGDTRAERAMNAARLYACLGLLALPPLLVLARFGMLQEPADALAASIGALSHTIVDGFSAAADRHAAFVLDRRVADLAPASLAAGLMTVLTLKFTTALGLIYGGLLAWGMLRGRAGLPTAARGTWRLLFATALLIVTLFVLGRQFVAGRYLMTLCLLALIPGALVLRSLARDAERAGRRGAFYLALGVAIALLGVDGFLSFGTRKDYRHQGIAWMHDNLPAGARVFSNDRILAFYSGGRFDWGQTMDADALIGAGRAPLANTDYWILQRDGRNAATAAALAAYAPALEPLESFDSGRGERIEIFRVAAGAGAR